MSSKGCSKIYLPKSVPSALLCFDIHLLSDEYKHLDKLESKCRIAAHLEALDVDVSLVAIEWFLCLFSKSLSSEIFRTLGTPNETIWPGYSKLPSVRVNFVKHQESIGEVKIWKKKTRKFWVLLHIPIAVIDPSSHPQTLPHCAIKGAITKQMTAIEEMVASEYN
uniref:Uncharacterized protein n=1 Tax=Cucumis melo TaxID=3656 RepID=A0A9I9CK99_CUCME